MFITPNPFSSKGALRVCCATLSFFLIATCSFGFAQAPAKRGAAGKGAVKVVTGQPGSVVFIRNIRHGVTGDQGTLELPAVRVGVYPVRVRSVGFADWRGQVNVTAGGTATVTVKQQPATDEATLKYQKGDQLRDQGQNKEAVAEYKESIRLRPVFPEARIGLARSLVTLEKFDEAEAQIVQAARQGRATLAEAQTVLANMRRSQGLIDESIVEYRKALKTALGVSPEAHIGLAIALEEAGQKDESIKEYRLGISQDMDTESILYYLLGNALEKMGRKKEAIDAYQGYLRLDPEGQYSSAVESIIEQLKEESDDK